MCERLDRRGQVRKTLPSCLSCLYTNSAPAAATPPRAPGEGGAEKASESLVGFVVFESVR